MTIDSIVSLIGKPNIADRLDETQRQVIADDVIRRAAQDLRSMKDWMESVDWGVKLCKPEYKPKSDPWPNAANYKSTILTEAANTFGNRAAIEIMRDPKLVKSTIIGLDTIKNVIDKKAAEVGRWKDEVERISEGLQQLQQPGPDGAPPQKDPEVAQMQKVIEQISQKIQENEQIIKQKKADIRAKNERADRVAELMNWQVNVKMEEWRKDQKRLMYSLPNVGSLFKKTYYDDSLGRCVSKVINYPDFIINQKTESMKTCRSFTHILAFTKAEAELRIRRKLWLDANLYNEDDDLDAGGDEASEAEDTIDNNEKFYEQYCWLDIDNDGAEEPYIVTVHVGSAQVVRIVARYDEDTIIVKGKSDDIGIPPMALLSAQQKRADMIEAENAEFNTSTPIPDPEDLSEYEVVRIEPVGIITKYGMIPSFDGTFLDVGYYHLIGANAMGVNKTTNDLLNAGTLANTQSGIVARNFRKKPGAFSVKPGEFSQTEASAEQLQSSIMMLPFKEPSQGLFMLNEKMENSARSFSANVDADGQIQSNTAPTTALAIIQESMIQHTAHMSMIVDSMSDEFKILFELNRSYLDSDDYKEIVGDDEAVFSEDFQTDGLSVVSSANPEMASRMQRMMLAEAEMSQVPMVIQAGGNPVPIIKGYYKRIGSENLEEIFPNEAEMSPEEKAQMKQMQQQQEYANQLAEQQVQMITLQTELLKSGEARKDRELEVTIAETMEDMKKTRAEIVKLRAEAIKFLEQAESEEVKNKISIYTAASAELDKAEAATAEEA